MILKKIVIGIFLLSTLNACVQNVAFIGPAITVASTGNVCHAGLSYGSSRALNKITGKTATENIKSFLSKNEKRIIETKNADIFFNSVKENINKSSNVINLANQ